jgi:hypothetical protein
MGKIMPINKKGGVVTSVVMGVGGLIIAVIVILVITSTIGNANLIGNDKTATTSETNESVTFTGASETATLSPYTAYSLYWTSWNATRVMNGSTKAGGNQTLVEGVDYQVNSATGSITNLSVTTGARVTYSWTTTETYSKDAVTSIRNNFTSGINNVSSKVPTILLIVAVVFLFGALVLLIRNAQAMGMFESGGQGSL